MRESFSKLLIVLALGVAILIPGMAMATIVTGGFNQDEVYEIGGSISNTVDNNNGASWAETGYGAANGNVSFGLPSTGSFLSATGSGVSYHFQPYTGSNALRMGNYDPSFGTLTVTPGQYSTLYILATSGNGGGSSDITLNFSAGGPSIYTNALYAPDWYRITGGPSQVALGLLQRITVSGNNIDGDHYPFQFYESVLTLNAADQARTLESITFNDATGGHGATSVYDVAVPLPPTVLLLGSGILGLVGLRWRRARKES